MLFRSILINIMGDKDKNYNDTSKKVDEALPTQSKCCGVVAVPGLLYQSTTICTICPNCKAVGATEVESSWSIKSYLCCYYYGACWWCWQTAKGKDYTLKNGLHRCSSCKSEISDYQACE